MPLIWFIIGVGSGVAIICLTGYCSFTPILLSWWEWFVTYLWLILVGSSSAFILTSLWEGEKQAAFRAGFIMVTFSVITGALLLRFVLL